MIPTPHGINIYQKSEANTMEKLLTTNLSSNNKS